MAVAAEPEQQLAWEARQRPRAAIAAILAAVLTLAGYMWAGVGLRDTPDASFLASLGNTAATGSIATQPSLKTPIFEFYNDNGLTIVGSAVVRSLALLALGWTVTFLAAATRARRPEFMKLAVYLPIVGAGLAAVATVLGAVGTTAAISEFLDGPRTVEAARDVGGSSLLITAEILGQIGPLALVAAMFLVALNAMRAGLLTRFLGFLGIIAAVLTILPLMPLPVVQSSWLILVGLMLFGTVPGGMPPAWRTGRAEPWPSGRRGARGHAQPDDAPPDVEPIPQRERVVAGRVHPSSKKRKRKRRG